MSKVIHLSDDAHALAKTHCKSRGMRMSDWVASLIQKAIKEVEEPQQVAPPPKPAMPTRRPRPRPELPKVTPRFDANRSPVSKKALPKVDGETHANEDRDESIPAYAAPPFWARGSAASSSSE